MAFHQIIHFNTIKPIFLKSFYIHIAYSYYSWNYYCWRYKPDVNTDTLYLLMALKAGNNYKSLWLGTEVSTLKTNFHFSYDSCLCVLWSLEICDIWSYFYIAVYSRVIIMKLIFKKIILIARKWRRLK